jgi:hypothetical protein
LDRDFLQGAEEVCSAAALLVEAQTLGEGRAEEERERRHLWIVLHPHRTVRPAEDR